MGQLLRINGVDMNGIFKSNMPEKTDVSIFEQQNTEGGLNVTFTGINKKRYTLHFDYESLANYNQILTYCNVPMSYTVVIATIDDTTATQTDIFNGVAYLTILSDSIQKIGQSRTFNLTIREI